MTETFIMNYKEFEILFSIVTNKTSFILPFRSKTIEEEEAKQLMKDMEKKGLLCKVDESVAPDNTLSVILQDMADAKALISIMNGNTMIYFNEFIILLSKYEWQRNGIKLKIFDSVNTLLVSDEVMNEIDKKCICHFIKANKTLQYKSLATALKSNIFSDSVYKIKNREAFNDS